jgi:hypothetical protein
MGPLSDDATVDEPLNDDVEARDEWGSSADDQGGVMTHQTTIGHNVKLPALYINNPLLSQGSQLNSIWSWHSEHYYIRKALVF